MEPPLQSRSCLFLLRASTLGTHVSTGVVYTDADQKFAGSRHSDINAKILPKLTTSTYWLTLHGPYRHGMALVLPISRLNDALRVLDSAALASRIASKCVLALCRIPNNTASGPITTGFKHTAKHCNQNSAVRMICSAPNPAHTDLTHHR